MSILFNADGEYLGAVLSDGPLETEWRLVAHWIKLSENQGSVSTILQLSDSAVDWATITALTSRTSLNGTPQFTGHGCNGATAVNHSGLTNVAPYTAPEWQLVGYLCPPNGGSGVHKKYVAGATSTANSVASSTVATRELTYLRLGTSLHITTQRYRGYLAEVSIWTPADATEADAIMTELLTKTALAVTAASPKFYSSLYDDATIETGGVTFTPGGSPTYHTDEHPTLSGPAVETLGIRVRLYDGMTSQANLTGLTALFWDSATPSTFVAPVFSTSSATTDVDGWLEIDIDTETALSLGGTGFLMVYKAGATAADDLVFASRVTVEDIA